MTIAARGNEALLGVLLDEPATVTVNSVARNAYNLGHPRPGTRIITAPAAPTSATSGVGLITGTVLYKVALLTFYGETTPSTAATGLVCTANAVAVTIAATSDADAWARKIYRSHDAGATYYWIGSVYDKSTTTFADTLAIDDASLDFSQTPQTYNQTGANWGMAFMWPDSWNLDPKYGQIATKELKGSTGMSRGAPGNIDIATAMKLAARCGWLLPLLAAIFGKPTQTDNGDGTQTSVFTPSVSRRSPYSLTFLQWEGGSLNPEMLISALMSEIDVDVKGNALVELDPKGMARHHSKSGMTKWSTTANATYSTVPVVKGIRTDSGRATTDVYVKVASAPSAGSFTIKCKLGSGTTYGSTACTVYYDATTKKQIQSGSQPSDWVELLDSNSGNPYGADTGENRAPFSIMFPGDVTTLSAATPDTWIVPASLSALVPGVGTTPGTADSTFTGFAPRTVPAMRFTNAHGTLYRGATLTANPATYVEVDNYKMKLAWALAATRPIGSEARTPVDFDRNDFAHCEIDFARRFVDVLFQDFQEQDTRLSFRSKLVGEQILVQPGVRSTNRFLFQVDVLQQQIEDASAPIGGPNVVHESVKMVAEQSDNLNNEPFTITVVTGPENRWFFRA